MKVKPIKEVKYALIDNIGRINPNMISYSRKSVEEKWLSVWDSEKNPSLGGWKCWYRNGYRIKKVTVTIELTEL